MPRKRNTARALVAELARLPRQSDLIIEGGKRPLGVYVREKKQTVQPQLALWLDAQSSFIRGTAMIDPLQSTDDGVSEAVEALVMALANPVVGMPGMPVPAPGGGRKRKGEGRGPTWQAPQPALPAKIVANDAAVAAAARDIFEPLGVAVEVADHLPAFDAAFRDLAGFLGADDDAEPPEPFAWEIDQAVLPPLYQAARQFGRNAPWEYMPDHPPLAITLGEHGPEPGVDTLYASILGAGGTVMGVAFYYSLDDVRSAVRRGAQMAEGDEDVEDMIEMLRQSGAPVDEVPPDALHDMVAHLIAQETGGPEALPEEMENSLVFFLEAKGNTDPTYLEWLADRQVKFTSRQSIPQFLRTAPGTTPRWLREREARALTLATEALNAFCSHFHRVLQGPFLPLEGLTYPAQVTGPDGPVTVTVAFPPPGYEWDAIIDDWDEEDEDDRDEEDEEDDELEGPEEAASPAAATTLYRFLVKLEWKKSVWRRIEMRGDQTLHDLHEAIQEAFDWDDDHLYAFFLSGRAWDERTAYQSPYGDGRSAARYRLERLPLAAGQQFLYIFDFGDELRHLITLEAIERGGVQARAAYPRITERHGASVPQY